MQKFRVSTKITHGYDPDKHERRKAVEGVPHCAECLTTEPHDEWIYVDCAGMDRFCSWDCLFVWTAWMACDAWDDPRIKIKEL